MHLFGHIDLLQEDISEKESGLKGAVSMERLHWKHLNKAF